MRNDQTRVYRDQRGTWTDVPPDIILDDWDRIGEKIAFNAASRANRFNLDGTRKTHKDVKFPNGVPAHLTNRSPRKMMKVSEGDTENPAREILNRTTRH